MIFETSDEKKEKHKITTIENCHQNIFQGLPWWSSGLDATLKKFFSTMFSTSVNHKNGITITDTFCC